MQCKSYIDDLAQRAQGTVDEVLRKIVGGAASLFKDLQDAAFKVSSKSVVVASSKALASFARCHEGCVGQGVHSLGHSPARTGLVRLEERKEEGLFWELAQLSKPEKQLRIAPVCQNTLRESIGSRL